MNPIYTILEDVSIDGYNTEDVDVSIEVGDDYNFVVIGNYRFDADKFLSFGDLVKHLVK